MFLKCPMTDCYNLHCSITSLFFPHLPLKEASIRRFKNLYQSGVKKSLWKLVASTSSSITNTTAVVTEIQELPRMQTGRPLLLPEKLDRQVQEYIRELCKRGATVSKAVVVATAGNIIIMNKDANLLYSNGGGIKLSDKWGKSLLNRMGYVKRKACSKAGPFQVIPYCLNLYMTER